MESQIENVIEREERLIRSAGEFDELSAACLKRLIQHRRLIAVSILKCQDEDNLLILEDAYEMYNQQIKNLLAL